VLASSPIWPKSGGCDPGAIRDASASQSEIANLTVFGACFGDRRLLSSSMRKARTQFGVAGIKSAGGCR